MAPYGCIQNGSGVWSLGGSCIILSYSERERIGEVIIRQTLNIDLPLVYHIQSLLRAWAHFKLVNSAM